MFKNVCIILIIASFASFLIGVLKIHVEVEENACRMTYMFGVPQFSKVDIRDQRFPHYGLYYYYEGRQEKDVNKLQLKGAPVIFVPGNAGSYKQVRSLASVALRKGMDNERGIHLDYFTINYEEQLSALYGGYLQNQKQFLQICIRAVQRLYAKSGKSHKTVVLIGHSMGGKVAQSILEDAEYAKDVNSIIFISSPIDSAVVNLDSIMNEFYTRSNSYLSTRRTAYLPQADTNLCRAAGQMQQIESNESTVLENVLLISIGGGNRDLLVRDALTSSKYSDVHAMTSSIPKVWLSCDHLSAVWCLQLIMVINRFLFGITNIDGNSKNVFFIDDKLQRNETALNYFVKPINRNAFNGVQLLPSKSMDNSMTWTEDSKIVLRKHFKNGLRSNYHHLIPLNKYKGYKKIYVEINGYDLDNDWIFGCKSFTDKANKIVCNEATSLSHYVQNIPSNQMEKTMALIDIENMLKSFPEWTHILVRIPSGSKPIILKIDVYKMQERQYIVKAPKWFMLKKKDLINETVYGTIHYEVLITDLTEPFPTLEFNIEPIGCVNKEFHVVTKLCIPWARGFQRYQHITHNSNLKAVYVNVPIESPNGYNSTTNPLSLELFLDPVCRYKISYRFSIEATSSKIVQEFYHWLPAHLVCVLIMVLRNIIVKFQNSQKSLFVKPYAGFFQCKSLYIITGCRLLYKLILPLRLLPVAEVPNYSFFISIIIHSTAIVASILCVFIVWTILTLHGNILYKIALRITRLSVSSSNVFLQIISTLPLTFGVAFISIAFATCSGIALVLSAIFYFILISNSYKDYLENWAWETASGFYKKLRKTLKQRNSKVKTDVVPLIESRSELIESDSANEINATEQLEQNDTSEDEEEYFEGLENFSFHITMLLLLIIMSALNVGLTIAWIKSKYQNHIFEQLADPHFWPTVLVLSCLSLLLQLNAPHKSRGYNCCISILLYISSCCCIIYSQENIYQLNYIIGFVYLIITIQELGHRLWAHYS